VDAIPAAAVPGEPTRTLDRRLARAAIIPTPMNMIKKAVIRPPGVTGKRSP
jgi:hypothetical protein